MTQLTRDQMENMRKQGLSDEKISQVASERGLTLPSAGIGGFLGKVARFTGVEKLGQGLGYALFQLTPEYRDLKKMLESGQVSPEQFQEISTGNITNREVIGSAIRTAGTIIGAGTFGKALTPAVTTPKALGTIRRGAAIGAG